MTAAAAHFRLAIIGSGLGGLGATIRLRQKGCTEFAQFERAERTRSARRRRR